MTLDKQTYVEKPREIEAVQFTGGAENGPEIVDWLVAEGVPAVWLDALEASEETSGRNESIRFNSSDVVTSAVVSDYIIKIGPEKFKAISSSDFAKTYAIQA